MGFTIGMVSIPETMALIVGKKMGKNNFSYFISPKKTWEGAAGQVLAILPAMVVVYFFVNVFKYPVMGFNMPTLFFMGLIIIFVSILGDLMESVLKRGISIKDSSESNVIGSGLGGLLDKFDSFGVVWLTMSIFINILRPAYFPSLTGSTL